MFKRPNQRSPLSLFQSFLAPFGTVICPTCSVRHSKTAPFICNTESSSPRGLWGEPFGPPRFMDSSGMCLCKSLSSNRLIKIWQQVKGLNLSYRPVNWQLSNAKKLMKFSCFSGVASVYRVLRCRQVSEKKGWREKAHKGTCQ